MGYRKLKVFFLIILVYSGLCISEEVNSFFKKTFHFQKAVTLTQDKMFIATIRQITVGPEGNFWILDSKKQQIYKYSPEGIFLMSFGGKGQGPGEFLGAFDFSVGKNRIYIVDPVARKVSAFKISGKFENFFIIEDGTRIRELRNGDLLIAAPLFVGSSKKTACLHIYNKEGNRIRTFFPINKMALDNNLICGSVHFDLDPKEDVFCIQEMDYKIFNYDLSGKLINSFAKKNDYYITPTMGPKRNNYIRSILEKWIKSWTHIFDIRVLKDKIVVILSNYNKPFQYIVDIYNNEGSFIRGNLKTNNRLMCVDKQGNYYFLSTKLNSETHDTSFKILVYSLIDEL